MYIDFEIMFYGECGSMTRLLQQWSPQSDLMRGGIVDWLMTYPFWVCRENIIGSESVSPLILKHNVLPHGPSQAKANKRLTRFFFDIHKVALVDPEQAMATSSPGCFSWWA